MNQKTFEGEIAKLLPDEMKTGNVFQVRSAKRDWQLIIEQHLHTLYGERADWSRCIESYFQSEEYKKQCSVVNNVDDIPLLDRQDINNLLDEEKSYEDCYQKVLQWKNRIEDPNLSDEEKGKIVYWLAGVMGLLPDYEGCLNQWLVDKRGLTDADIANWYQTTSANAGLLRIIIGLMIQDYVGGTQTAYADNMLMMRQRKSKNYYRGENAYYGSSRPSAQRRRNTSVPLSVQQMVENFKIEECKKFFNLFDVVREWKLSSVNYVALGQHYGLHTNMMDITSNLKTALFFACCKYGADGSWYPLTKKEFEFSDSRKDVARLGGDSRYGIIYISPTEIHDMRLNVMPKKSVNNMVIPVGYQPFMRCSSQYAYMFMVQDEYDMYKEPLFTKYKFELSEDICNWIYEEMEHGDKIYPKKDIPDIADCIEKINSTNQFSRESFLQLMSQLKADDKAAKKIEAELLHYGYQIVDKDIAYIDDVRLANINSSYTIEKAENLVGDLPVARPLFVIG